MGRKTVVANCHHRRCQSCRMFEFVANYKYVQTSLAARPEGYNIF